MFELFLYVTKIFENRDHSFNQRQIGYFDLYLRNEMLPLKRLYHVY